MSLTLMALLIGGVAGLRAMTAPCAVSWAAYFGWLPLQHTKLAVLGTSAAAYGLTVLAIGELIADKLPVTPSRKTPLPFGTRLLSGGLCGVAVTAPAGGAIFGLVAGVSGAVIATLGGYEIRSRLAAVAGRDLPVALLEDLIAVGTAILIAVSFG